MLGLACLAHGGHGGEEVVCPAVRGAPVHAIPRRRLRASGRGKHRGWEDLRHSLGLQACLMSCPQHANIVRNVLVCGGFPLHLLHQRLVILGRVL